MDCKNLLSSPTMNRPLAKNAIAGILALISAALIFTGCGRSTPDPTVATAEPVPAALPGDICVVSEEELGSMGEPFKHIHQGHAILFCCKSCLPEFNRNSDQYIAALKSGEPAGGSMP
jgi:hypothetical protein